MCVCVCGGPSGYKFELDCIVYTQYYIHTYICEHVCICYPVLVNCNNLLLLLLSIARPLLSYTFLNKGVAIIDFIPAIIYFAIVFNRAFLIKFHQYFQLWPGLSNGYVNLFLPIICICPSARAFFVFLYIWPISSFKIISPSVRKLLLDAYWKG